MLHSGYSATVAASLLVNGTRLAVSHIGSSGIILSDQCGPIPACQAELRMSVDNKQTKKTVFLPNGISGPGQVIKFF